MDVSKQISGAWGVSVPNRENRPTWLPVLRRLLFLLGLYGLIFAGGKLLGSWLVEALAFDAAGTSTAMRDIVMWVGLALYVGLLALPFVPGMEISIALFAAFGSEAAIPIYFATIAALIIPFVVGRNVPLPRISAAFKSIGFEKAHRLMLQLEPLSAEQRVDLLVKSAPSRLLPVVFKYRYLAIILVLNMPGNAVLGGGGGIALLAGLSGLFSLPRYSAAVAVGVLPVPLAVAILGQRQ